MLELFRDMNMEMQQTGQFGKDSSKEKLLQMVAENNMYVSCFLALEVMSRRSFMIAVDKFRTFFIEMSVSAASSLTSSRSWGFWIIMTLHGRQHSTAASGNTCVKSLMWRHASKLLRTR
jgi:hypothetical protein